MTHAATTEFRMPYHSVRGIRVEAGRDPIDGVIAEHHAARTLQPA
jgi:hypothetical protein